MKTSQIEHQTPTCRKGTEHLFLLVSLLIDDLEYGICHCNPQVIALNQHGRRKIGALQTVPSAVRCSVPFFICSLTALISSPTDACS